jgi:HSP20 family protein
MFELLKTFSNGQDLFTARPRADFGRDLASSLAGWAPTVTPVADVIETADAMKVQVDVPGFDADSLRIQFENDVLSIEGERRPTEQKGETYLLAERRVGKFARAFSVNVPIDADRIEAAYDRGVLTVTLLKRPEAKPRKIDVKVK